jgi:hypothetical protein
LNKDFDTVAERTVDPAPSEVVAIKSRGIDGKSQMT